MLNRSIARRFAPQPWSSVFFLTLILMGGNAWAAADPTPVNLQELPATQQFEFLIGEWDYAFAGGCGHARYWQGPAGTVMEHLSPGYVGPTGFAGFSILIPDSEAASWQHNWIDSMGNVLQSKGALLSEHASYDHAVMQTEFAFQGRSFRHVWYGMDANNFYTDLWMSGAPSADGSPATEDSYQMIRTIHFWRSSQARSFADDCNVIKAP